ncbi:TolC family protein [Pantoea sp. GbtcB22]|uniref:TolC family protein n=1 Tax=Pantoea sp. GbtcB22 TaxID=2824767 RepID=UPI001C302498|nr:TolC family protein [Pantoea sp. GbtcB22]
MNCHFKIKQRNFVSLAISAALATLSIFSAVANEDDELLSFVAHSSLEPAPAIVTKNTTAALPINVPAAKSVIAPVPVAAPVLESVPASVPKLATAPIIEAAAVMVTKSEVAPAVTSVPHEVPVVSAVTPPVRNLADTTKHTSLLSAEAPGTQAESWRPSKAQPSIPVQEGQITAERQIKEIIYGAVSLANRMSPTLNRSRAEFQAAQENVSEAKGQRWPQVDVSTNSKSINFGGGARTHQSDIPAVTVNMVTTVYDFGRLSNTIESRESSAKAANSGVAAESENTAWEVSSQLIELSKERLIISISEQYVARMNQLTTMLSGIVAADPGRRSELTQARGQFLKAKTSLDAAVSRAREIEINLYKYIGDAEITLPRTTQWQITAPNLDLQLRAISDNPLIAKARAETEATLKEAAAVKASGLPALNWVVSKNTGEDEIGRREPFKTGLQLSWGIFRGGSTNASERAALMRAEASRQQIEETTRDLEHKIRTADQDAISLRERAAMYQNLSRETDRIRVDFFDQWYHLGKRTLLDVLSAESEFYGNRVGEVTSRFDSYSAVFQGYASAGILTKWLSQ